VRQFTTEPRRTREFPSKNAVEDCEKISAAEKYYNEKPRRAFMPERSNEWKSRRAYRRKGELSPFS